MFQKEDIGKIMKQMALDISLMNQFNLMDYSLLFCVEYNPEYVKKHIDQFTEHEIYKCYIEKNKFLKKEEDERNFIITKENEEKMAREFVNKMLDTSIYDLDDKSKKNKGKWATIFKQKDGPRAAEST